MDLDVVASATSPSAARVLALVEGEARQNRNEILIENEANIFGARAARIELLHLFVSRKQATSSLVKELAPGLRTSVVDSDVLGELFQRTRVPEVFAIARMPAKQVFRAFASTTGDLVVLDSLHGPGNIGSIIRIAAAFEAGGVVFLNMHRSEIYRRGIIRASAGTMFKLPLVAASTEAFLRFCRASGTRLVATSSHASGGFQEVVGSPDRLAIILGSETQGAGAELTAAAEIHCRIPMSPGVESLNVSAACSVLLFARSPFTQPDAG